MKKIFSLLVFVFVCLAVSAESTAAAKAVKIAYQSINEYNEPVTLTATLTMPSTEAAVTKVLLNNAASNRISSAFLQDTLESFTPWNYLVGQGVAIVEPDNAVMSNDSLISIPKFTYNLAGRQTIDALSAAIEYLKANSLISDKSYTTYNIGYGLGANVALSAQRSLEEDYTTEQKSAINLGVTFIGGASPVPTAIWQSALANDSAYSAYRTLMMLDNVLKSYAEGCMKSFTEKDVFSQEVLDGRLVDLIYTDKFSEAQVAAFFALKLGTVNPPVSQLLSADMLQENSAVRRAVEKALAFNNLTADWTPQYNIYGALNDTSLINQIQGDKYTDITDIKDEISSMYSKYSAAAKLLLAIYSQSLATKEDQFLATVFTKVFGQTYFNLPILSYYNSMLFMGNLYVDSDLTINIDLNTYSMLLAKIATMNINIDGNVVRAATSGMAGKLTATYCQMGKVDFNINATDILPVIENITYLMQVKTFTSEADAQAVAAELNKCIQTFTIDVNGQTNWFTGSFTAIPGETEGTYTIDVLFTRTDESGKSITFHKLSSLLF